MTKKQFVNYIHQNHPHLEAHEVKPLGKKGFFQKDLGAASSFCGFNTWSEAYSFLVDE